MARERAADHLPAHVLERPDFARACAERDLGEVLRIAKQRAGVGFTASHLARRCEMTVSRVQDYINGRVQAQRVEVFERVADGLHIPGEMFDLAARPWQGTTEPTSLVDASGAAARTEDGEPPVLRREFVKLGAGVAAATLASQLPGVTSHAAGSHVGPGAVQALRANFARLRPLDDHIGGGDTYRLYSREVGKVENALKHGSLSGGVRRDLLTLYAEEAQQAGWAAFDAGWHNAATWLYKVSLDAAKEAGSRDLTANALALRSYQLLSTGTVATEFTDKACSIASASAHPAVRSLLYQRGAWTYAIAGDADKTAQMLGLAEDALVIPDEAPSPEWAAWAHDETEWRIMAGRCWAELHKPLRAVPVLETAMAAYGDIHARDKALYLSWLADAYLDAGELEHARDVTSDALSLADGVASARPHERLGAVLDRLKQHPSVPGLQDLLASRSVNPIKVRS